MCVSPNISRRENCIQKFNDFLYQQRLKLRALEILASTHLFILLYAIRYTQIAYIRILSLKLLTGFLRSIITTGDFYLYEVEGFEQFANLFVMLRFDLLQPIEEKERKKAK